MIITNEPFQTLEYKEYADMLDGKLVGIVEKNKVDGEWNTKIVLMNRTQALKLALGILETYEYAGRLGLNRLS